MKVVSSNNFQKHICRTNRHQTNSNRMIAALLSITLIAAAGCSNKRLKQLGTIVAVGIAAKVIYDMVVDYQSKQVVDEGEVVNRYKKAHGSLPDEPVLVNYTSNIRPGEVVTAGKDISIQSDLEVVRGSSSSTLEIKERITIFDNEDNNKALKSLTKVVNQETNSSGAFHNEFTFKLPKGMPQGVYPVQTTVIVDGKSFTPVNSQMQLVYNQDQRPEYRVAKAN